MEWLSAADKLVHLISAIVSTLLLVVSFRAYRTKRDERFLYVAAAFAFFFIKEIILLYQAIAGGSMAISFSAHMLNVVILACFFGGITR